MKLEIVEKKSEKVVVGDLNVSQAFSLEGEIYLITEKSVDNSAKAVCLTDVMNGVGWGNLFVIIPQTEVEAVYEVSVRLEEI